MIVVALAAVLSTGVPATAPSPLPLIITTKSTPLCTALREQIAPAVFGLMATDHLIGTSGRVMDDMDFARAARSSALLDMDQFRLSQLEGKVAQTWVRVNQDLNELSKVSLKDPQERIELESARAHLQAVADRQAVSLNVISGISETVAMNELLGRGDGMHGALGEASSGNSGDAALDDGDSAGKSAPSPGTAAPNQRLSQPMPAPPVEGSLSQTESATQRVESGVTPVLLPLVKRCSS